MTVGSSFPFHYTALAVFKLNQGLSAVSDSVAVTVGVSVAVGEGVTVTVPVAVGVNVAVGGTVVVGGVLVSVAVGGWALWRVMRGLIQRA